jgi:hypothetical protein
MSDVRYTAKEKQFGAGMYGPLSVEMQPAKRAYVVVPIPLFIGRLIGIAMIRWWAWQVRTGRRKLPWP